MSFVRWFSLSVALIGHVHGALAGEENWVNLYDAVTAAGKSLSASSTSLYGSGESGNVNDLFNGIIYANGTGSHAQRVLMLKPAEGHPSVTVTLPADGAFATGKRVVLRRVDLYPATYSGNAKNRMPTEYKVYGFSEEDGQPVELLHAEGLEYPNLGNDAKSNEFYSVEVPASAAGESGFRRFKLEFISSPAMSGAAAGAIVVSFMEIGLQVELLDDDPVRRDLYDVQNLTEILSRAGYAESNGYLRNDLCSFLNVHYTGRNLFDGATFTKVLLESRRWLGYVNKGCYVELRVPQDFRPNESFYLKSCRAWCLSNSGNELYRAPTAWKVFGLADAWTGSAWTAATDEGWTELASRTGDDWTGVTYAQEGQNTLGKQPADSSDEGYRAFRFRPTASQATAKGETGIDVGLDEFEFFVIPVNRKGTLLVRSTVKGLDFGDGLADGSLVCESGTMTVPEYVVYGSKAYRVTGYRPETFDYEKGEWSVGETVAARSFEYVRDDAVSARIVWEVEEADVCRIEVVTTDGGNESPVTVDPVKDFYALTEEITVTAHPNADVLEEAAGATNKFRSAFVRWEGDTNGIADVTSPTITFTAGENRRLTPVFRRDWLVYEYDLANEGGEGTEWRMRDGNFEIRCYVSSLSDNNELVGPADWLVSGYGSLDLDTKIVRSDTGAAMTIRNLALAQLGSYPDKPRNDFTRIVLPRTLTKIVTTAFRDQKSLAEVVIDCPELTELGTSLFTRDTALSRITLKTPKLKKIAGSYLFYNAPMDETDASDWRLDSLVSIAMASHTQDWQFSLNSYEKDSDKHGFRGTLTLPAVTNVSCQCFHSQQFVTNVVLGSAKGSLQVISDGAFGKNTSLASLTIGCGEDLTVAETAFSDCSNLKDVTFLKFVPQAEALDAILANATATARANVYVTPNRPLWEGFLQPIGEDDPNPPEGAVGVYRTAAGERKAWVFYKESPLDPKGILLIVR